MQDSTLIPGVSGTVRGPWICLSGLALILMSLGACTSDLAFRRFELGQVEPQVVLETAEEVISEFYSQVHGGVDILVDRENLKLETGYIKKRIDIDFNDEKKKAGAIFETPKRQKFCLCVIPSPEGVAVEVFATFEVLCIEDPDEIQTGDDIWKFVKQDTKVEDLLVQILMERLVEKGYLE